MSKEDYDSFKNNTGALKPLQTITSEDNVVLLDATGGIKDSSKKITTSVSVVNEPKIPTVGAVKSYVDTNALLIWNNLNDLIDKPGAFANLTGVSGGNFGNVLMWNGVTATYTQLKTHTIDVYTGGNDYNDENRLLSKEDYTSFVNNIGALKPLSTTITSDDNVVLLDAIGGIKDSGIKISTSVSDVNGPNIPTVGAVKSYVDTKTTLSTLTGVTVGNSGNVLMWNGTTAQYTQLKTHTIDPYTETDYNNLNRLIWKEDYDSFKNNTGALKPLQTITSNNNFVMLDATGGIKDSSKTFVTNITGASANIPTEGAVKTYVDGWLVSSVNATFVEDVSKGTAVVLYND